MSLDLGNYALNFAKDDDVSVANLTTRLGQLTAASVTIGSSASTDLNILGDIVVAGLVDGIDIAALNTTVAGLGAPSWASITSKPTTIGGFGITDGLTTDFNTNTTASFTGTYLELGAPGDFVIRNAIQTGTAPGTYLVVQAGNASGADQTGGDLRLAAGSSTGSVYSGNVSIWGNPRMGSSSLLNTPVEYATFMMNTAQPQLKFKDAMKSIYGPDVGSFDLASYDDLTLHADVAADSLSSEIKMKIQAATWWSINDVGRQYAGASLDLGVGPLVIDATLSRHSAGDLQIESNIIYRAGGTDVPIADGGTGASTLAAAKTALEIPVDLTVDGAGTVHANNYTDTNTTYSLATNTVSGLCQVHNAVDEDSIVCDSEDPPALRRYKIQHDIDTDLSVCVPWTDTVYTHPTTAGNLHIPSGGATGQYLRYAGASGTAAWSAFPTTISSGQATAITANTAKAVQNEPLLLASGIGYVASPARNYYYMGNNVYGWSHHNWAGVRTGGRSTCGGTPSIEDGTTWASAKPAINDTFAASEDNQSIGILVPVDITGFKLKISTRSTGGNENMSFFVATADAANSSSTNTCWTIRAVGENTSVSTGVWLVEDLAATVDIDDDKLICIGFGLDDASTDDTSAIKMNFSLIGYKA